MNTPTTEVTDASRSLRIHVLSANTHSVTTIIIIGIILMTFAVAGTLKAQTIPGVPPATYRWNFDQADVNSTNRIFLGNPDGWHSNDVVAENPAAQEGELGQFDQNGNLINFLANTSSGVSSGLVAGDPVDRALFMPTGSTLGYITRTPNAAAAITNLGLITSFSFTCWVRETGNQTTFARFFMLGQDGIDDGNPNTNGIAILIYNFNDIQLKIHNVNAHDGPQGGQGLSTGNGPLKAAATNWVFIAVTCDMALPTGGTATSGTNTWFYVGDRADSLLATNLAPNVFIIPENYDSTSINSVFPAATDGPGYINYDPTFTNGDGSTLGISNVYVAIGNRYFQNGGFGAPIDNPGNAGAAGGSRPFNGDFDDIRFFANKVLTLQQVEAIRTNAPVAVGLPLKIVQQPVNTTIAEGQGAGFSAVASDAGGRTYQWFVIPHGTGTVSNTVTGATNSVLETGSLTVASNNGDKYGVLVHSTDPSSDNGGAGAFSSYATVTILPTNDYVLTPGMLKFEYYSGGSSGVAGDSVSAFLGAPPAAFPNTPDQTLYIPNFDSRGAFPDDSHNNYFVRTSGWITPTVTTNYVFYLRAGSEGQLYLSPDNTTNDLVEIANDSQTGPQLFYGPEESIVSAGAQYSVPQTLQAGSNYAVVAYLKASGGDNFLQVAWRMNSDSSTPLLPTSDQDLAERLEPIPSSDLSCLALPLGTVSITHQPGTPASVPANSKITFGVGATDQPNGATSPLVIQWQKNGVNIDGATGGTYTTPYLSTTDNGSTFGATISFPGAVTNSQTVTVNVTADNKAPAVLSAISDDSMNSVVVLFSKPVDPVTAMNPANYSIPGLAVSAADYSETTNLVDNPPFDAIKLTTSPQADSTSYTVSVHNVQDTTGHIIGVGNSASFTTLGSLAGFAKFSWYEDIDYENSMDGTSLQLGRSDDNTVVGFVTSSPKYINNDPDTINYPQSLIMTPQGNSFFRNAAGAGRFAYPPGYFATRLEAIITPTNTGSYVFYMAAADSGLLWLSTDANPANKHLIAFSQNPAASALTWSAISSQSTDTNSLMGEVADMVPSPTPWPFADGNGIAVITLTNGQHYYLEADERENFSGNAFLEVNWDGGAGVAPTDGTATVLSGNLISWHFTQPQITSFAKNGGSVSISWITNTVTGSQLGAVPYPGVIAPDTSGITDTFPPSPTLQTATLVTGPYANVTNTSPATLSATNSSGFFRLEP